MKLRALLFTEETQKARHMRTYPPDLYNLNRILDASHKQGRIVPVERRYRKSVSVGASGNSSHYVNPKLTVPSSLICKSLN